jgi:CBS domain-containing protein/osmotically-inducible protein OsmY
MDDKPPVDRCAAQFPRGRISICRAKPSGAALALEPCMHPHVRKVDPDLQQDVLCELAWDSQVPTRRVGVVVKDGVVTLIGTVDNWATARAAERAAHRVAGVLDVANDLVVKLPDDARRTDAEIAQAVRRALERDAAMAGAEITSTVSNGIVTLAGTVPDPGQWAEAEAAVSHLVGVRRVIDHVAGPAPVTGQPGGDPVDAGTARFESRRGSSQAPARGADATKVRDLMMTRGLVEIDDGASLAAAAHRMSWQGCRHLPVIRGNKVVGVLSERDVLRWKADGRLLDGPDDRVRAAMSAPAVVATPDEDLAEAAARMVAARVGCLPVVEHGRLVGMLTSTDLLGHHVARRLTPAFSKDLRAADLMTANVLTASSRGLLLEAADMMAWKGVRHLPVVDENGRLVGMLSERDLRTLLGVPADALEHWAGAFGRDRTVEEVMVRSVESVRPDQPLSQVIASMVNRNVGALPVVDAERRPVGIISYLDVLSALAR